MWLGIACLGCVVPKMLKYTEKKIGSLEKSGEMVEKNACSWRGSNSRPSHFTAYMASQSHAHTAYKYDALTDCATGAGRQRGINLLYITLRQICAGRQLLESD